MARIRYFVRPVKRTFAPGEEPWRLGLRRQAAKGREMMRLRAEPREREDREERD